MKVCKQATIATQELDLEETVAKALEKALTPIVAVGCEINRARRKEYPTEKEVALLYPLSPATLKTQRS